MRHTISRFAAILLERRSFVVAIGQAALIVCSLYFSWLLRFDFHLTHPGVLLTAVPVLLAVRLLTMRLFSLHHGWWRYTGVSDALDIVKAVVLGSAGFFLIERYLLGVKAFPLSIYVIEGIVTAGALLGVRLLSRALAESVRADLSAGKRVVVIGAGSACNMLLRELRSSDSGYVVVGCVDDNPSKRGIKIQGTPVLGGVDTIPEIVKLHLVDEVLIAVPSSTSEQMRRFVEICDAAKVPFRTVPGLRELLVDQPTIKQIREVKLEDLLGRETVGIDMRMVREQIEGKVLLVTGAAGSIGSEICRQILGFAPARLVCLDMNETGIFFLEQELGDLNETETIRFYVGDIGDSARMLEVCSTEGVQVIFHAAAYKHVPVMEANVHQAVKNNVFGLLRLLDVAEQVGAESLVMISSDKAVNPSSVMGCTKRIGELILSSRPRNGLRCVSVRFGNVLGSSGSVVPIFQEQLRRTGKLTVTHPEMTRFFMTTREAVSLVLQAFAIGQHGDILVLDMGQPVRIVDLARNLIRLSGKSEKEVEICFTGLRHGEKMHEELFYPSEQVSPTNSTKIKRTRAHMTSWEQLCKLLSELDVGIYTDAAATIRQKLRDIVPEFSFEEETPGGNGSKRGLSAVAGLD